MKSGLKKLLARIARSSAGSILPMTAAAIFVLAGMIGGGIDISRGYMVENRLQNACDAGTLAGRRAVDTDGFDDTARAQADLYFNTNFDKNEEDVSAVSFNPVSSDNGNTISGTATATLPTVVMNLFGYNATHLAVACSASMSVGNSDVVMVLDVTGSMEDEIAVDDGSSSSGHGGRGGHSDTEEKILALQNAMKAFYQTVHDATVGSNARVRYGFVPYSSSVNLKYLLTNTSDTGDTYLDPDYIANTWPIQSRQPDFVVWSSSTSTVIPNPQYGSWSSYSNGSCPSNGSWQNNGSLTTNTSSTPPTKTQPQRRTVYGCSGNGRSAQYRSRYEYQNLVTTGTMNHTGSGTFVQWEYKQITYDVSSFKNFNRVSTRTGTNGASVSSTWAGCVEERKTLPAAGFAFDPDNGIVTDDAHYDPDSDKLWDLDIDSAPDPDNPDTLWGPMWPDVAYLRSASKPVDIYCPQEAQPLMQMSQTDFNSYADSLEPIGGTYHDIGMLWGARLSSPGGIFAPLVNEAPNNGGKVARHVIFMTDGDMCPSNNVLTSYGIEQLDRRITTDGGSSTQCSNAQDIGRHTARFRAICDAIKAKGIRIWVIAFSSALNDDLTYCASTNSSFTAGSASELNSTFQEIAKNVGELRVVS